MSGLNPLDYLEVLSETFTTQRLPQTLTVDKYFYQDSEARKDSQIRIEGRPDLSLRYSIHLSKPQELFAWTHQVRFLYGGPPLLGGNLFAKFTYSLQKVGTGEVLKVKNFTERHLDFQNGEIAFEFTNYGSYASGLELNLVVDVRNALAPQNESFDFHLSIPNNLPAPTAIPQILRDDSVDPQFISIEGARSDWTPGDPLFPMEVSSDDFASGSNEIVLTYAQLVLAQEGEQIITNKASISRGECLGDQVVETTLRVLPWVYKTSSDVTRATCLKKYVLRSPSSSCDPCFDLTYRLQIQSFLTLNFSLIPTELTSWTWQVFAQDEPVPGGEGQGSAGSLVFDSTSLEGYSTLAVRYYLPRMSYDLNNGTYEILTGPPRVIEESVVSIPSSGEPMTLCEKILVKYGGSPTTCLPEVLYNYPEGSSPVEQEFLRSILDSLLAPNFGGNTLGGCLEIVNYSPWPEELSYTLRFCPHEECCGPLLIESQTILEKGSKETYESKRIDTHPAFYPCPPKPLTAPARRALRKLMVRKR